MQKINEYEKRIHAGQYIFLAGILCGVLTLTADNNPWIIYLLCVFVALQLITIIDSLCKEYLGGKK